MNKEMERFVADVQKDEELAKLVHEKAGNLKSLSAALKEHGYEATDDEIKAFVQAQAKKQNKELSDEDLDAVAGGRISVVTFNLQSYMKVHEPKGLY